jgi:hypothetical protein
MRNFGSASCADQLRELDGTFLVFGHRREPTIILTFQCSPLGIAGCERHIRRMAKKLRGLYCGPGWAYVSDGNFIFDMPESRYRDRGYEPPYDQLPSKNEYEALKGKDAGSKAPAGMQPQRRR